MSFGLDPELFVMKKGSTTATSIHLLKNFKPQKVRSDNQNPVFSMSKTDGFAFELTNTPSTCRDYIIPSMAAGLKTFLKDQPKYNLSAKVSMPLNKMSTHGKTPIGVCNYGCIPDRDAFTLNEKTPPTESYHNKMRYIGGHIHMGLHGFPKYKTGTGLIQRAPATAHKYPDGWTEVVAAATTLQYDAYIGVPMVAILGHTNDYGEAVRRTYYGQAGSHRVKDYGVEYRVLSGALMMSPFLLSWALGAIRHVSKFGMPKFNPAYNEQYASNEKAELDTVDKVTAEVESWFKPRNKIKLTHVQHIIDTHDVKAAQAYIKACSQSKIYNMKFVQIMIEADIKGISLPTNITDAWQLNETIFNHAYPGVETLMHRGKERIKSQQFKAINLIKPTGWRYDF